MTTKPAKREGARPGHTIRETYGGEGARKAIIHGKSFNGLARKEELAVTEQLALEGIDSLIEQHAIRLTACANLFWNAIEMVCSQDEPDLKTLDMYATRFTAVSTKAIQAWRAVQSQNTEKLLTAQDILGRLRDEKRHDTTD